MDVTGRDVMMVEQRISSPGLVCGHPSGEIKPDMPIAT
jgi:hypothetical protein